MTVFRLAPKATLSRALARLRVGDVLIAGTARIVPALDPPHDFWVERGGTVTRVARRRDTARRIRAVLSS